MKVVILFLSIIPVIQCYYKVGHQKLGEYTKELFQKHNLYTNTFKIIGNFKLASSWADKLDIKKKMPWSKQLHYINLRNCDPTCKYNRI